MLALCDGNPPETSRFPQQRTSNMESVYYCDVIMGALASQITSLKIIYSTVYSGADQRKHQSSASLAFVWGIHRGPVNSPHKRPVTRKIVSFWWRHHARVITSSWLSDPTTQMGTLLLCYCRHTVRPWRVSPPDDTHASHRTSRRVPGYTPGAPFTNIVNHRMDK